MNKIILCVLISGALLSCKSNNNAEKFDPNIWTDNVSYQETADSYTDSKTISIPYTEKGGVKYITAEINDGPIWKMIVDTGCSGILISMKEAQYLAQAGLLSEDDYRGNAQSFIADGSIVENMVFNIKELIIGGQIICKDVDVTVSNNISAPMLLGNAIFDLTKSMTIDNENKQIVFQLK